MACFCSIWTVWLKVSFFVVVAKIYFLAAKNDHSAGESVRNTQYVSCMNGCFTFHMSCSHCLQFLLQKTGLYTFFFLWFELEELGLWCLVLPVFVWFCSEVVINTSSLLQEFRAFELLRSGLDRSKYLLVKEAKIIAMTCTHAALKRHDLVELGFKVLVS